jgi:hypothetical protein
MRKVITTILTLLAFWSCEKTTDTPPVITPEPEVPEVTYNIGDLYDANGIKGLIFRVNSDGKSGLIVSLNEPKTKLAWSTELVVTNATSFKDGAQNTATIFAINNWQDKYPAFVWCKSLGEGWYIPSVNELKELLLIGSSNTFQRAIVANKAIPFSDGKYLSSTEQDEFWVHLVDYNTNTSSGNYKQYTYNIRAIHAF